MNIRRVIKEQGWTLARVAAEMRKPNGEKGLSQAALSQLIINGNPTFDKLQEIADILGITVSELVREEGNDLRNARLTCPHCGREIELEVK